MSNPLTITFRAKVHRIEADPPYDMVNVPELKSSHADRDAFRRSRRFGAYANSDLFESMIRRAAREAGVGLCLRLDRLPPAVTVAPGFLATVTITVPDVVENKANAHA